MVTQYQLFEQPRQSSGADGPLNDFIKCNREKKALRDVTAVAAQIEELHWLNYNLKHRTHFASKQQRMAWRARKSQILLTINKK